MSDNLTDIPPFGDPQGLWEDRRVRIGYETAEELARCYNRDNWRAHPENQRAATEESLDALGLIGQIKKSTVNNLMFDGHLRVELALAKNPQMLLPVDYYDLNDDETALALTIHDAITEQAEPIPDKLAALLERTRALTADRPGLGAMLERLRDRAGINGNGHVKDVEPQIDKAAELQKVWGVQVGDVFELGQHRLVCGDCTDRAVVESVMRGERADLTLTDPPYDFETQGGGILGKSQKMKDIDDLGINSFDPSTLQKDADTSVYFCNKSLIPNYIELAKKWKVSWDLAVSHKTWHVANWGGHLATDLEYIFILGKQSPIPGQEPELYSKLFTGMKQDIDNDTGWAKPVALCEKFIRLYTQLKQLIYDPFLGSGTTMVAAHQLNRRCFGIEIEPSYCAVTLERWSQLTGQTPRRVSG